MRRSELVFDEPVGGEIVRHPQKRFSEHHKGETLLRRQGIFAQKIFDSADADRFRPHRGDETQGAPVDPRLGRCVQPGVRKEMGSKQLVFLRVGSGKRRMRGVRSHARHFLQALLTEPNIWSDRDALASLNRRG